MAIIAIILALLLIVLCGAVRSVIKVWRERVVVVELNPSVGASLREPPFVGRTKVEAEGWLVQMEQVNRERYPEVFVPNAIVVESESAQLTVDRSRSVVVSRSSDTGRLVSDWSDCELLARLVWAEARGECFDGKKAVVEVVMNRLASRHFPNSVHKIVFQTVPNQQFCTAPYLDKARPDETCYAAVDEVLAGIDPVLPGPLNGKLIVYFDSLGGKNGTYATTIGGHTFSYCGKAE